MQFFNRVELPIIYYHTSSLALFALGRQISGYLSAFGSRKQHWLGFFLSCLTWCTFQCVLSVALVSALQGAGLLAWPWVKWSPKVLLLLSAFSNDPCGRCWLSSNSVWLSRKVSRCSFFSDNPSIQPNSIVLVGIRLLLWHKLHSLR